MGRLATAFTIAAIGTALFAGLGAALWGLFGSPIEASGCFFGSFFATLAVARPQFITFTSNLLPSLAIVVATLITIAAAHAIEQPLVHGVPTDSEWHGFLFWSFLLGPWWLVPGCAYVLSLLHRRVPAA
jgi:hypothetical protein